MKKWIFLLILWALVGLLIHNQFDPNTVIGSVIGSVFIFFWFGVLVIGIFINQKSKKKK